MHTTYVDDPKLIHSCHFWNPELLPKVEEAEKDLVVLQRFQRTVMSRSGGLTVLRLIHALIDEDSSEMNLALWKLSEADGKVNGAYEQCHAMSQEEFLEAFTRG